MANYIPSLSYASYISAAYRVSRDSIYDYWYCEENTTTPDRVYPSCGIYNAYTTFFSGPSLIIDNLYLGSAYNAANYSQLKDNGIEIIINMTNEIGEYFPNDFTYRKYGLRDNGVDDIGEYLKDTLQFIYDNRDKKILVHCKMGASRSASIVIYYLMKKYSISLEEALEFTKQKRIIVNPNNKFIKALKM